MKKLTIFLLIANCTGLGTHAAALDYDPSGCGYIDSISAAFRSCEWPEEYPGSDEPGVAYNEGKAAAEDADCHEDE